MIRKLMAVLGAVMLSAALPIESQADTYGCSCIHNTTGRQINFRYRFGAGEWKVVNLQAAYDDAICWNYGTGPHTSPPLVFQLDVDMTNGQAWTAYALVRWQSPANTCNAVPAQGHYDIAFRPGTNNLFVHVVKHMAGPGQPPPPGPALPYGPDTCKQGFVWREATASDHVCVPPQTREEARVDNSQAAQRRQPGGGAYGPDTCVQGYVWREAVPGDHVCVSPATRDKARNDNALAAQRRVRG